MESDEERAARGGERERGRAAATREARGGSVGEDRKRKRETETDSVLDPPGIDAFVCQNAETPASFLPSFLLSSRLFSSVAVLSYSFGGLSVFLSLRLSSCPPLRFSFSVSLFSCPSLSRSFSRVSSSVLSCRAADADAGASSIAATVGAATHTLHLPPFHPSPPSPFSPSVLSTLFEKQRRWPSEQRTRR